MNDDTSSTSPHNPDMPEDGATDSRRAAPENGAETSADETAALKVELGELRSAVLYAKAETQNVRRRMERDAADARAYAATAFARDMLSVADNLTRALAAIPAELRTDDRLAPLVSGIEVTAKELDTVFARHGIVRIEALGQPLDPNRHQAMVELPSDDAAPGTVVQEMQPGYMLKDRLLRPALVGVARS